MLRNKQTDKRRAVHNVLGGRTDNDNTEKKSKTDRLSRRRERPLEEVVLLVDVLAVVGVLLALAADD